MTGSSIVIGPLFDQLVATRHSLFGWIASPGYVSRYSGIPGSWTPVSDPGITRIAATHDHLYALKVDGTVLQFGGGSQWTAVAQGVTRIKGGGDGLLMFTDVAHGATMVAAFDELTGTAETIFIGQTGPGNFFTDGRHHVKPLPVPNAMDGAAVYDRSTKAWVQIGTATSPLGIVNGVVLGWAGGLLAPTLRYSGAGQWVPYYEGRLDPENLAVWQGRLLSPVPESESAVVVLASFWLENPTWTTIFDGGTHDRISALVANEIGIFATLGTSTVSIAPPSSSRVTRAPQNTTRWLVTMETADQMFAGYDGELSYSIAIDAETVTGAIPNTHFERGQPYWFHVDLDSGLRIVKGLSLSGTSAFPGDQWRVGRFGLFNPDTQTYFEYTTPTLIENGSPTDLGAPMSTKTAVTHPSGFAKVFTWDFRLGTAMGHASMRLLDDNTYISWWPNPAKTVIDLPAKIGWPEKLFIAEAFPNQTFADDVALEGGLQPDNEFMVGGLDNDAIRVWWLGFKTNQTWRTFVQNCSTTVADALWAGGVQVRLDSEQLQHWKTAGVWTPNSIYYFVKDINTAKEL